jgi:hypothetical protein
MFDPEWERRHASALGAVLAVWSVVAIAGVVSVAWTLLP